MADILKENFDLLRQLFSDVLIAKNSTKDVVNVTKQKQKHTNPKIILFISILNNLIEK